MKKSLGKYSFWGLTLLHIVFLPADVLFLGRAWALSLDEIIARTQSVYEKTIGLKADFIQETTIKSMGRTEREEGIFFFKNPHRMVWDYIKPKTKKLIINPQMAWLYVPEDNMVYKQDAKNILKSRIGLRFLSGLGKLREDFHIVFASAKRMDREGNYLLKLVPAEKNSVMGELSVAIDKKTFHLVRLSFADVYGNTTRLYFKNIKIDNKLPEEMFSFSPPPGTDVYNEP